MRTGNPAPHNIAISIDDLGADWASFTETTYFPFVEIKVDRKFIAGCAEDRLKQVICRRILQLAESVGEAHVAHAQEVGPGLDAFRDRAGAQ